MGFGDFLKFYKGSVEIVAAYRGETQIYGDAPPEATAPGQFASGDWSVSTGLSANQVVLNVSALPSNGGASITALEFTIDGGTTWTALSGTGTGARTLTMAAAGTAYTFALRAVNAVGAGTASATKSATSGAAAATPPSAFAAGDWSVATGASASQVTLTVSALPSNGGSAITALQYTIDGGTTWTALSGTGTGARTLTMPAAGTAYTFALRAVNAVGAGTASATKSATSGAAAGPTLRKDLIWLFGDSRTAYTSTTTGTAIETLRVGADGGWASILLSRENNRFAIIGKTATGGDSSTALLSKVDAGIAAAVANGCGTAILLIGVNDMSANTNPSAAVPSTITTNVPEIISRIQAAGMQVVVQNEWPASGEGGTTNKPLMDWYKAQRDANAWPGVIWADTAAALGSYTTGQALDINDFALGTVRSSYHASYSGAEKVATALQAALAVAIPTATYGTPLFEVDKDRPAADYISANPFMAGTGGSVTGGITGQAPNNYTIGCSPTVASTTLTITSAISTDADGEQVVTFTFNGTAESAHAVSLTQTATRVLPTRAELTGKCFALGGWITASDISKFTLLGVSMALTGGGVTRTEHAVQLSGTPNSALLYNVSGARSFKFITPPGKVAPAANPTNVSGKALFTIPAGTVFSGETITVRRMAAGFAPLIDYVAA